MSHWPEDLSAASAEGRRNLKLTVWTRACRKFCTATWCASSGSRVHPLARPGAASSTSRRPTPAPRRPRRCRDLGRTRRCQSHAHAKGSATERALTKIGDALRRDGSYEPKIRSAFSPGVIFSREWKGVVHLVTVTVEGFDYRGKKYRSLSDIARTITGTRWSGPRFFGLEQKRQSASRGALS